MRLRWVDLLVVASAATALGCGSSGSSETAGGGTTTSTTTTTTSGPAPTCSDGAKNGDETDVDCGGVCGPCADGKGCAAAKDCTSGECINGSCGKLPQACLDGKQDGDESDVDCGGKVCPRCKDAGKCAAAGDCASGVCSGGKCQPAKCDDKAKNGKETDVDCGGPDCPKCGAGKACTGSGDCADGPCIDGVCGSATCADGVKDGKESDVDCGGDCAACGAGKVCSGDADCVSGACVNGKCADATCNDGLANGGESDVDCGGPCVACELGKACAKSSDCMSKLCFNNVCVAPGCGDAVKNGNETDVDCGGGACLACADGKTCGVDADCQSLRCQNGSCAPATCGDGVKNGKESDLDCGGPTCPACAVGKACTTGSDCSSSLCFNDVCVPPGCGDAIKNGSETDVDCGGGACPACTVGKVCNVGSDCLDGFCGNGVCTPPACDDGIKNGAETDVDCGGPVCKPCITNLGCKKAADCESNLCVNSQCQVPSCKDGVKNGTETDVDCGGLCPQCAPAQGCKLGADCWNGVCDQGACGHDSMLSVGGNGNPPIDPKGDGSKLIVLDPNGAATVDRQASLLAIARYVYVANSGEGTVSKIDPTTFKEIARYCTAPGCNADPSRTSVSLDGNVGVANRANYFYNGATHAERASAVMIAGDISKCVDRNGNGKIDTFVGSGAVPAQFQWPTNTTVSPDECVLWWTPLVRDRNGALVGGPGTLPRSATFDSKASPDGSLSSNFYVGLYGTSELAQLDAKTGQIVKQVGVGGQPYSSVFDRFGNLWIRDAATSRVIKVDTNNPALPATFVGPAAPCAYAITADSRGNVYSAGGTCVARMDPNNANPTWETLTLPGACFPRGSSLDAAFNLWVPDTCYGGYHVDASKPVGQGMTLKKAIPMNSNTGNNANNYILGTAIDGNAMPYFINTETGNLTSSGGPQGSLYRVDAANNYAITSIRTGATPYVYSDLSGSQLALTAPTTGSYNKNFTAWCGNKAKWKTLTWTDTVPAGTTLQVRYRAGKDAAAIAAASFVNVGTEPPAIQQPVTISLPQGTDPTTLQVEFVIATSDTQNKPSVSSVAVTYSCP
jgi:hypothetical protein